MVDSTNVLLLRPAHPSPGLSIDPSRRPSPKAASASDGMLAATICHLADSADAFPSFFKREVEPALRAAGADVVAGFATEHAANNFPRLPVREGEEVFVWLAGFADQAAHDRHAAFDVAGAVADWTRSAPETWRLTPTARSLLPDPDRKATPDRRLERSGRR
jgi:hypothetical protein